MILALAGCGGSDARQAVEGYDPAEVQLLRDQATSAGVQVTDELLLSTLQTREDCRTISTALDDFKAGRTNTAALARLRELPAANEQRGQAEVAKYLQGMIDRLQLGDATQAQTYWSANCADVT